jgi:hypothetical protein
MYVSFVLKSHYHRKVHSACKIRFQSARRSAVEPNTGFQNQSSLKRSIACELRSRNTDLGIMTAVMMMAFMTIGRVDHCAFTELQICRHDVLSEGFELVCIEVSRMSPALWQMYVREKPNAMNVMNYSETGPCDIGVSSVKLWSSPYWK